MKSENYSHFTSGPLVIEEVMKLVSVLENPPEAEHIRRALALYDIPERLKKPENYKWGRNSELIATILHYLNPQSEYELGRMLEHVRGKTSLLEVGSNFGGTLQKMAAVMPRGSKIVSVDADLDQTPKFLNPVASLKETCRKIGMNGGNVELIIGNSHSKAVIEKVRELGPYDFVFIDGDHSYEGVKEDWENYGPMGKIVAFHDIAWRAAEGQPEVVGCRRFWDELKSTTQYRTEEYIDVEGPTFGIGVVFKE